MSPAIDWLALHATGTKAWDKIEARLIRKVFHEKIPHISAFKRTFGHTLSSACLFSIAMIAEGLAQQRLPILPQKIDPEFALNFNTPPKEKIQYAMNWSVGMGGSIAVNLFEACHV
jgi:3-oxoacyl-(acyl-carrier-protein) synthase